MSGHEFQLHNRVDKLAEIIGLKKNDAFKIVTYLEKDRTPFNPALHPMHESLTKLANNSSNPSEFTQKYNELKGKNVRDLDAFVFFLSELCEKAETPGIKKLLEPRQNFTSTIESTIVPDSISSGNSSSKLSSTALAEVFNLFKMFF
ncbi:gamma-tubulin complex component 2 [Brachionus plicatilis]|uniref:Gamma-tubulin complex component 2 n=1 Tax=Brachionus plicatilis TaxID=10195 RepID=A0A3M7SUK1_BRAPC|nr:gamma-tubulin complex component 2 [Brachionus plicatilis]